MKDICTGQGQLVDHPETEVFIQADVLLILGIEITGDLFHVQTFKHRPHQPAGISLSLTRWIDTDKKEVAVGRRDIFL